VIRYAFIVTLLAAVAHADAQAQQWRVDVQAGRIRSALDPSPRGTESVAAGIGYDDPSTAFRFSTGVPTRDDALYWGAVGAWKRLAVNKSGLIAGVDLSGNGFLFQSKSDESDLGGGLLDPLPQPGESRSGHALAGQVMPLVGFERGPFLLQTRAGLSHYSATISDVTRDRTVRLGDLQLTVQPSPSFAFSPVVKAFRAEDEDAATFAGVSAVMAQGRASVWGNVGQWLAGADTASDSKSAWGVGASLRVMERATLSGGARRDGFDPLHLNPPQTSWNVGLSIAVGGRPGTSRAPVPSSYEGGLATIQLPVAAASSAPSVAGDFNSWKPAQMSRDGKFWTYTVAAAPGVYNYAFVSGDGTWFVPENVPGRKDDGMGGHVAILVVR
jgi:hypothetical protein